MVGLLFDNLNLKIFWTEKVRQRSNRRDEVLLDNVPFGAD